MRHYLGEFMNEKRDFREETLLNAAEEALLKEISGKFGVSKSAALRICLHHVGDQITRQSRLRDTGILTDV